MAKLLLKKKINSELVYDITVADNHNFYANNILVHNCTNKSSKQGEHLLKLDSPFKVGATGTLLTNSPISMYVPLAWTENDMSTLTNYKSQYCTFGGYNNSQVVGYHNLDILKEEVNACSIRRTLKDVRDSMPEKFVKHEIIEMSKDHKKFYDEVAQGIKESVDKVKLTKDNLLALTTRLRQATVAPSILTTDNVNASKIERCIEIVEDLISQNEKVVILSTFKEPAEILYERLKQYGASLNTGDTSDDLVSKNNKAFQNDPNSLIFIGTHGKCGTGITLNAAAYLIMLDTPYNHSEFAQSADRIYRVNNTRPAMITVLVCKDTIDERVMRIVNRKKGLSDYIIDDMGEKSLTDELRSIIDDL